MKKIKFWHVCAISVQSFWIFLCSMLNVTLNSEHALSCTWKISFLPWLILGSCLFLSIFLDLIFSRCLHSVGWVFSAVLPLSSRIHSINMAYLLVHLFFRWGISCTQGNISCIKESSDSSCVPSLHWQRMIVIEWMDGTADNLLCVFNMLKMKYLFLKP